MLALLIAARFFVNEIGVACIIKTSACKPSIGKRLAIQYLGCSIIMLIVCLKTGDVHIIPVLIFVGLANSLANYAYWLTTRDSLSQATMFTFDDSIAIILGAILLQEYKLITWPFLVGALLMALAISTLSRGHKSSRKKALLIAVYSLIWGGAAIVQKVFHVPLLQFLLNWYIGSTIGSLAIASLIWEKEHFQTKDYIPAIALSVLIPVALALQVSIYKQAPIMLIQPILMSGKLILPTLVGIIIFKERVTTRRERTAMILAACACVFMVIALRGG